MIHFLFLLLNALIMMALPFVLGHFLSQRLRFDWGLFGVGAITFILSQVGHIPFNQFVFARVPALSANLILLALFGGLSAGVFEEVARYLMYRFWVRDARDGPSALILGLGHGGIESFLLGLLVGI
ncbi:MAG: YhfC family intramembrane metalloprotease, partial [Anaerolineales bacterium]|nr:YhfC family intramembrane metalloprotease [Anaerolineales bacterium]